MLTSPKTKKTIIIEKIDTTRERRLNCVVLYFFYRSKALYEIPL